MSCANEDIADPRLYKLYWGYMLEDICYHKGLPPTKYVKERLHEIHKKALKYNTIAGQSQKRVSQFLMEVAALWACYGVFVRTRADQPIGMEEYELKDVWHLL